MVCVAVLIDGDVALVESGCATMRYYRLFAEMALAQQDMYSSPSHGDDLCCLLLCSDIQHSHTRKRPTPKMHQLEVTWARAMLRQTNPFFRVRLQGCGFQGFTMIQDNIIR